MMTVRRHGPYLRIRTAANIALMVLAAIGIVIGYARAGDELRSSPPDTTPYSRPLIPEDLLRPSTVRKPPVARFFIVDTVVNNTNANLKFTDTFNDGETSIAVNPLNPEQIVITAFSGGWIGTGLCQDGTGHVNAPYWLSNNGGNTWTKTFAINPPPGVGGILGSPCDQTVDFGPSSRLAGTFLASTTNLFSARSKPVLPWLWPTPVAQETNHLDGVNDEDQPWLLVGPDPEITGGTNVYVAYDDFNTAPDMRVATAIGVDPLNFTTDTSPGPSAGFVNPGHRLAIDPVTGDVYSIFQRAIGPGNINYILNRSRDEASTWDFGTGVLVANGLSTQAFAGKFCTVNALLGGVDHAAVDPQTGDVIYVYGKKDVGGINQLAMKRLGFTASGPMPIGPEIVITTSTLDTAIPSVAIAQNGAIGIFYYTCDSVPPASTFPIFTAHFAITTNGGLSFVDHVLETFMSPALDNGDIRQRVLGDYMQVKALGNTFFGSFTGNGAPFGRTISNNDPIFYKVTLM